MSKNTLLIAVLLILVSSVSIGALPVVFAASPGAPTGLGDSAPSTKTSIFLTWTTPASDGGETITGYKIESSQETGFNAFNDYVILDANTASTGTTYTVGSLSEGDFFKFRVSAINSDGTGTTSNEFMMGTEHGIQDFSNQKQQFNGGQNFGEGTQFAKAQDFDEAGVNHDFSGKSMEFGAGSDFAADETFGEAGNFDSGIQLFDGANTFGEASKFAASQSFTEPQTFAGGNTFGDGMQFAANQSFDDGLVTAGTMELDVAATGLTNWFDIMALITTVDTAGENTNVTPGDVTVITALASGTYTTGGMVFADFSAVTSGSQINDVIFTDLNSNGKIDCTGTADDLCDLADLPFPVTFADASTLVFDYEKPHTFGSGTVFGAGAEFAKGQTFTDIQDFSGGGMNFAAGMKFFAASQDFDEAGVNHDFSGKGMEFAFNSDFAADETFGEAGNFTAGVQLFDGANTFGKDSKFAASQSFGAVQTFNGTNTFGAGTTFAASQDFNSTGIVTSASTAVATNVLINDMTKQNAAFPSIAASSGIFENGLVTITFSDVDVGTQDKIQEIIFTDADLDGIIDDGELGAITAVTTSSDTMIITQAKTQNFDAGAQVFGTNVKFAENQKFSDDVQTFGTGTEFNGNADFIAAQTFVADVKFDDGQDLSTLTNSTALSATGMTFGSTESVDFGTNAKTFGASAIFAENQDFTKSVNHDLSATDMIFKKDTAFLSDASEVFGEHVTFAGVIEFPDDQAFPAGAEFADSQTFDADQDPVFNDFTTFGNAVEFAEALDFKNAPNFEGTTTFTGVNTFGAGAEFETGVTFSEAQTLDGAVDFGKAILAAAVQPIKTGSQFDSGSTFHTDQTLPLGTVLSTGIILTNGVACGSAVDCIPADADNILSIGEIISDGTVIPAIKNTVTKDNPSLDVTGLGVSMTFASITEDGNLDVTVKDSSTVIANTGAVLDPGGSGALTFPASGKSVTTVSNVIDLDLTGNTASSGAVTITLPYNEAATTAAGFSESSLQVSHYIGDTWVIETDCTVDTAANTITCNVDSVE